MVGWPSFSMSFAVSAAAISLRQASATSEPAPAIAQRLDRLEQMMSQLVERELSAPAPMPAARDATHPLAQPTRQSPAVHPPERPASTDPPQRRFRLTPAPGAEMHPIAEPEDRVWLEPPSADVQHPLNNGIGTSHFPSWMPLEFDASNPAHPLDGQ